MNNVFKKITFWQYALLGLIILIGFLFRIYGSLYGIFAYTYDVGRDLLAVARIIDQHKIPLIGPTTGMEGVFYGPWWYYLLTIPYVFSHGNPIGISVFMGLLGEIAAFIAFFVGKKIQGIPLGLLLSALISFSPQLISNQIWNPYMAIPFIMALFWCIAMIYADKVKKISIYYFLTGLCLGFVFDSEIFFGMLFSIGTVIGLIVTLRKKITVRGSLLFVAGFVVTLLPRLVFDLRHGFLISKHFMATIFHGVPQTHSTPFLNRLSFLKDVFLELWVNTIANGNKPLGYVLLFASICFFIFYFKKARKIQINFAILSLVILLTYFVYFSTNSTDIFSHFIIGLPLVMLFIFGLSLSFVHDKNYGIIMIGLSILIAFVTYLNPIQVKKYFDHSWVGDASVYKNEVAAAKYVYQQADGRDFTIKIFTPTGTDYAYTYLFHWLGSSVFKKEPLPSAKVAYFIIEPDTQYKNYRQKIWLNEHKNDGKLVESKIMTGDIIVQKREY